MRRRMAVFGGLIGVLGAGLLAAAVLPAASQTTIKVYERDNQGFEKFINTDGRSLAGDYLVYQRRLYSAASSKVVGRDVVDLTLIRRVGKKGYNAVFRAAATFRLKAGKIEAAGYSTLGKLIHKGGKFTVTGGTGAYAGARGALTVRDTKARTYFTFTLQP